MRLISFVFFLVMASPVWAQDDPALIERLQSHISEAVAENQAPGLSIALDLADGARIDLRAGEAEPRSGTLVGQETRFLSGSVGKTITALLAVQLAEDGALDLDAPISTWLSGRSWWDQLRNRDAITLRMLLNHSAGVPDYLEDGDFRRSRRARTDQPYSPDELVGFVAGDRPSGAPGAHYAYSDTHFILVGMIIETATERDFYSLALDRIVEPLAMGATEPLRGQVHDDLAAGHMRSLFGQRETAHDGRLVENLDHEWAAGGWVTQPGDLATLYRALGEGGRFADQGAVMRANFNAFNEAGDVGYGLGVFVQDLGRDHYRISHGGDFGGYRSAALYDSAADAAVATQANTKAFEAPDFNVSVLNVLLESRTSQD